MDEQVPQHIEQDRERWYWDWWRENPVEIVLVIFIIVMFFLVPWQGCGISSVDSEAGEDTEIEAIEVRP